MRAVLMRRLKNERGFTLIELMVVVVILGILAAIAVPQFMGKTDEAKISATMTTMQGVQSTINLYYVENGKYPKAVVGATDPENIDQVLQKANIAWPVKDGWDRNLSYGTDSNQSAYELQSYGKDGKIGGGDDVEATNTKPPTKDQTCTKDSGWNYVP